MFIFKLPQDVSSSASTDSEFEFVCQGLELCHELSQFGHLRVRVLYVSVCCLGVLCA